MSPWGEIISTEDEDFLSRRLCFRIGHKVYGDMLIIWEDTFVVETPFQDTVPHAPINYYTDFKKTILLLPDDLCL